MSESSKQDEAKAVSVGAAAGLATGAVAGGWIACSLFSPLAAKAGVEIGGTVGMVVGGGVGFLCNEVVKVFRPARKSR